MLKALNIRNFALVAELDIEFGAGLTVVTGESGAGKSILLDALSLVLGARMRRAQLRPGADACDVSAEFDVAERSGTLQHLAALAMAQEDDAAACLVRRTASERRSRAFVNGVPTTIGTLQSLTAPLIDIHGQYEHRQLLMRDVQRRLLDDFGVEPALVNETSAAFEERATLRRDLATLTEEVEQARERQSLLRYQIEELEGLGDSVYAIDELTRTHKRLSRAQELQAEIGAALTEAEDELASRTGRLANLLDGIDDEQPNLKAAAELAASAETHLAEASGELRRYLESFPSDETALAEADAALAAAHEVARRHRVHISTLGARLEELTAELASLSVNESRQDELRRRAEAAATRFQKAGAALSAARRRTAGPFADAVNATLAELGLKEARLDVAFEDAESAAGLEAVEFQATTNPRYPAGNLGAITSGGELSRIALAIDVVAAQHSNLPCLILDEADVGVGGTGADVLGRVLRRLSANTQVIAITHAPQIAALGDTHLQVSKTSEQDTVIRRLSGAERVEELARMLGGRTVTDESRDYARALLADGAAASR